MTRGCGNAIILILDIAPRMDANVKIFMQIIVLYGSNNPFFVKPCFIKSTENRKFVNKPLQTFQDSVYRPFMVYEKVGVREFLKTKA